MEPSEQVPVEQQAVDAEPAANAPTSLRDGVECQYVDESFDDNDASAGHRFAVAWLLQAASLRAE